jgi:cytochrome c2
MNMRIGVTALAALAFAWVGAGLVQRAAAQGQPAGDAAAGEDLFLDHCAICHVPEGGGQGPSLKGLYGRKAASASGFAYSAALKVSGLTWTGPELDHFLTNPSAAIPGTAMPITVPDAKERANLIAYFAAHP